MENKLKLGFGLMRLPKKGLGFDVPQICQMVDAFLEAGGTYFDTAFVYPGSEDVTRKALVERHPRESYTLATKLYAAMVPTAKLAKQELTTSLKRTGAGYFDYYLLHTLQKNNVHKYDKFELWDFVREQKEKGVIKNWGFSFHDGPELLDELLTKNPDADFVQLQINYADWENPSVTSRANYEVARKHGKPIVVMEPVKGGLLANPVPEAKKLFDMASASASYASWAIRYVASLEGILAVLSGMSNIQQMNDNLSYMKNFQPLSEQEREVIRNVQKVMGRDGSIACTSCHYCTKGCPKQIPIPEIFAARNRQLIYNQYDEGKALYQEAVSGQGKASDCIGCQQCEKACPQHLPITKLLADCKAME
ncbi:MAG: aldo/keto reductase [Firmicutes bacterium]|nr:aldo/keto reductase [Bacillota bacterium]